MTYSGTSFGTRAGGTPPITCLTAYCCLGPSRGRHCRCHRTATALLVGSSDEVANETVGLGGTNNNDNDDGHHDYYDMGTGTH